ncbi:hypothetical protein ACN469_35630 [Corallococcus terminator]
MRSFFIPRLFALVALGLLIACGVPYDEEEDARVCAEVECGAGRCVADEDGAPVCRCGAWEEAAGLRCSIVAMRQPDDHGDTVASATPLAPSVDFLEGTLQPPFRAWKDRDVFAVPALTGHGFRFTYKPGTLANLAVNLLDAKGNEVRVSGSRPGVMEFVSTEAVPRFIVVAASSAATPSGTYSYRLEDMGKDAHGDTLATATSMVLGGGSFPVTLEFEDDEDVFTFRTEPGHGFQFSCESDKVSLSLMNGAGVGLEASGSSGRVGHKSPDASTWFVRAYTSNYGLPSTRCQLDDLGVDEHSDVREGATPLTVGVPITARLQGSNDVDVFSFSFTAGRIYKIGPSASRSWNLRLMDADGKPLVESMRSGILWEAQVTGTYFLHFLKDLGWGSEFQVQVDDLGTDDHGGTPETATHAEVGETVTGFLHQRSDADAITVPLEADGVYRLTCTPDCELSLRAPARSISLYKGFESDFWHGHMLSSADVTFVVSSRSTPHSFTFKMERVGTDDHGDDAAHATPLTLPATLDGVFELGTDVDVLSFSSEVSQTYVVESNNVTLRILDPAGAEVPVVFDAVTRTRRLAAEAAGTYMVEVHSSDPLVGIPRNWSFSLRPQ